MTMFLKANVDENNIPIYTIDDYNNFKDLIADNKINKYYNIKSIVGSEINDSVFEKIIDFFEFKVYGKDYNLYSTKAKKERAELPLKPLVNKESTDSFEANSNKINEKIKDEIDRDTTDTALSIAADNADYSGKYNNPRKETAYYINKKIAENMTDDMSSEWDSDMDKDEEDEDDISNNTASTTNASTTNSFFDQHNTVQLGGSKNELDHMTDSELENLLKFVSI